MARNIINWQEPLHYDPLDWKNSTAADFWVCGLKAPTTEGIDIWMYINTGMQWNHYSKSHKYIKNIGTSLQILHDRNQLNSNSKEVFKKSVNFNLASKWTNYSKCLYLRTHWKRFVYIQAHTTVDLAFFMYVRETVYQQQRTTSTANRQWVDVSDFENCQ